MAVILSESSMMNFPSREEHMKDPTSTFELQLKNTILKETEDSTIRTYYVTLDNLFSDVFITKTQPKVSKVYLQHILYTLVNKNENELTNFFFTKFFFITTKIQRKITNYIENNRLTLVNFLNEFQDYYTRCKFIEKLFSYYSLRVQFGNKSYFELMYEYLFYINVINFEYTYNESRSVLWSIVNQLIKTSVKIDIPNNLHSLHQYYLNYKFDFCKKELFVNEIYFLRELGDDQEFVQKLSIDINKYVIEMFKLCTDRQKNKEEIDNLNKVITSSFSVIKHFSNRTLFYNYYEKLLMKRILSVCTDNRIEKEMFEFINSIDKGSNSIKKINLLLKDYEEIEEQNYHFKIMTAVDESGSYEKQDINLVSSLKKKDAIKFIAGREGLWNTIDLDNDCILSNIFNIPLQMFESYYLLHRHKERNLHWSPASSLVVVNYNVKDNDKETKYKIQMNAYQYSVLELFKDNKFLSGKDIGETLDINGDILSMTLNSLLQSKLIERENGEEEDITIKFNLNTKFTNDNQRISIVNLFKKDIQETSIDNSKSESTGEDIELLESIIDVLEDNRLEKGELILKIKQSQKTKVKVENITKCIELGINEELIKEVKIGTYIFYELLEDEKSDSEDES